MPLISGIMVATNGMLSNTADKNADTQRMIAPATAMRPPVSATSLSAAIRSTPAHLDGVNHDEQADEKEDRSPFDFGERRVRTLSACLTPRCFQLSSSISTAAPASAMVAG